MQNRARGVYFLASDGTVELATAFLNSFRLHNPEIPLCLIPFDAQFSKVAKLKGKFNFSIFPGGQLFDSCDEISRRFHGYALGAYRKFCIWEGAFDEFLYIDVDTVILSNIDFVFRFLDEYDFVASHSNIPGIQRTVWKPSISGTGKLSSTQIEFAANTGFIASKRGALSLAEIKGKTEAALELAAHMELFCMEQPYLNYLFVTSGKKYTSLFFLDYKSKRKHAGIKHELWAGIRGRKVRGGQLVKRSNQSHVLFMMHWAGLWRPGRYEQLVYRILINLRLMKTESKPQVGFFIPYKKLWKYYRNLDK
ncbi:MAG: hypothetical protein KAH12_03705 [Anaerolineales bacterium]|nr:hypothetical protein [Anaerolineales bacterium]